MKGPPEQDPTGYPRRPGHGPEVVELETEREQVLDPRKRHREHGAEPYGLLPVGASDAREPREGSQEPCA